MGNRGSSAVGRLIHNGKVSGAEMWCLDHDRKVLEQAGTANTVTVRKEEPHMVRSALSYPVQGDGGEFCGERVKKGAGKWVKREEGCEKEGGQGMQRTWARGSGLVGQAQ